MTIDTEHCIHTHTHTHTLQRTCTYVCILRTDGCPHDAWFKDGATQNRKEKRFHFGVHVSQSI